MVTTQITNNIGAEDNGCAVVALMSEQAQMHITKLLSELSSELEGVAWTMPAKSLHTTLCEIIQQKPYSEDKHTIYENHKADYEAVLAETLANYSPINITFSQIEVSPQAIIVRGEDGGIYNEIRNQLVSTLPFPQETKRPPDIVHCSIARFVKEVDITKVEAVVARHSVNFAETINEFQLMYPVWPHLLHYEIVRRYQLGDATLMV